MDKLADNEFPERTSAEKLPLLTSIGWGVGTMAPAIVLSGISILLLRYMTDYLGIAAAVGGALIAIAKVYDAVTDPLMGVISDYTKTKKGRRRPYLLAGGALLAISFVALFNPPSLPDGWLFFYMAFALILSSTAYTIFNVPYLAMPAEMAPDYHGRSFLMTFRVYALSIANLFVLVIGPLIITQFGSGASGHSAMAWALAPIVFLSTLICYVATKNAPFTAQESSEARPSLKQQLKLLSENRPFFILLGVKFFQLMALGGLAIFPFFFTRILELPDQFLATFFLISTVSMFLSQPVWLWVARRIGKKQTYIFALLLTIVTNLSWLPVESDHPIFWVLVRAALTGISSGGSLLMGQALLPDTQEYDALKTGLRREGLFAGIYTTIEKLSQAVGVALIGVFLGAMGYVESQAGASVEQSDSAILAIRLTVAAFQPIACGAALCILLLYPLSEQRLQSLRQQAADGGEA